MYTLFCILLAKKFGSKQKTWYKTLGTIVLYISMTFTSLSWGKGTVCSVVIICSSDDLIMWYNCEMNAHTNIANNISFAY